VAQTPTIIDREDELRRLARAADHPPQLVVMRGRRRIGKSYLLDRAFDGRRLVFFQADEQDETGQLELLAREGARLVAGGPDLEFPDWDRALEFFEHRAEEGPLVLILDEFQYLMRSQPSLDSIIARHWDAWQRDNKPITLALSGSALSLMDEILGHGKPLYGRADYRPHIQPLDYRWAAAFAREGLSAEEKLRRYATLGGTPQYQVWAGKGSLSQVIRERILTKGESLYEEPLHLLRGEQQIRDPGTYFAILAAIARGNTRVGEIANVSHASLGNLPKMLGRLAELDYIELREPTATKPADNRAIYVLRDPFFRFWFRYVFPNRSRLERGRIEDVFAEIDLDNFMGRAFEDCCREWIGRYAPTSRVPDCDRIGSWWSRKHDVEIDVVGVKDHKYKLLGSCKWDRKADSDVLGKLLKARDDGLGAPAGKADLFIFARGFDAKLVKRAKEESVTLVAANELFS
jgi:AAA+ ATPase superfamily predicted ATPase